MPLTETVISLQSQHIERGGPHQSVLTYGKGSPHQSVPILPSLPSFHLQNNTTMVSEQLTHTLYAPPGKKITSISDLWAALLDLLNEGDPVAKELVTGWQSLKNQSQVIVSQLCVKE